MLFQVGDKTYILKNYFYSFFHTINGDNMIIKLGYVALPLSLDITSSSTMTYTEFVKQNKPFNKLHDIIEKNLKHLYEILKYNQKNDVHFFRITSKLIPLATHKDVKYDYITPHLKSFQKVAKLIQESNIRVDFHPDQFTVLNSTNSQVIQNTFQILNYHFQILKALQIKHPILILHIGSNVFGKEKSMKRFIYHFKQLNPDIQKCIALENDDKIFNIEDVLAISNEIKTPVVLDYHHHLCNHQEIDILPFFDKINNTWKEEKMKIHFSSPKDKTKKNIRSHHDFINADEFIHFLELIKGKNIDIDIMIEAKAKEEALFRLIRELKYKTNYRFIDETTFEVK